MLGEFEFLSGESYKVSVLTLDFSVVLLLTKKKFLNFIN